MGILPAFNTRAIFLNNVRSLSAAGLLGLFSFGSLALILLLIPMAMIGFFAGQIWLVGQSPLQFLVAFILPHGILELPAAVLATALALQMGASLISPRANMTAGQSLLASLADFLRVFVFIVVPVLLLAAYVEANLTPQIVVWLYSR
ncbi:MAG: stage II sporulation protein M [Chloroflexi bacterium]|nr:stage II sporulation protein M [Chloroflexota bacterium]